MRLTKILILVAGAFVLAACPQEKTAFIEVGEQSIDRETFEKRVRQVKLLNPKMTRGAVAAGLVEGLVSDAVLARDEEEIGRTTLIEEREKLEANEKSARLYREVSRIYGDDHEAFLSVGLLPDMSLRKLHGIYERESEEEERGREVAATALTNVQKAGISFASLATEASATMGAFQITPDGSVFDENGGAIQILSPNKRSDAEAARRLWKLATGSADNTVLGIVLRTKDGYMLLKRENEVDGNVRLKTALFQSINFGEWLDERAKGVRACIHDETLRFQYQKEAKINLLNCGQL